MMTNEDDVNRIVEEYADTVKRICYSYMKNYYDTEDILQTVFLKYIKSEPAFISTEHEKAWIIRVTINCCKDSLKDRFRKHISLQEIMAEEIIDEKEDLSYVREAVCKLPYKYKNVILLYFFEEYSAVDIARILHKKENTIYTWLKRAKDLLKKDLGGDFFGE